MVTSDRYLRLTRIAQRAFTRGRLERSLRLFQVAEAEAQRLGDRELCDRAFCNRCVVLAELDRLGSVATELKHVLIRSRDPFTSWMAAYYTSQCYEFENNIARALAYARRASELAGACGERRALLHSANQHGVLALKDSHFAEASERFSEALRLGAEEQHADAVTLAIVRDNLGYCLMCTGKVQDGVALCADAAAALEATGTRQYLPEVYQDLCYGALAARVASTTPAAPASARWRWRASSSTPRSSGTPSCCSPTRRWTPATSRRPTSTSRGCRPTTPTSAA